MGNDTFEYDFLFRPQIAGRSRQGDGNGNGRSGATVVAQIRRSFDRSRRTAAGSQKSRYDAGQTPANSRRCVVKSHYVSVSRGGRLAAARHLNYIERDGVERDGSPGLMYDARGTVDRAAFAEPLPGEKRQFRFIISPEGARQIDLRAFARQLVETMGTDIGHPLIWAAVNHHDTEHPLVYLVVRGVAANGKELRIPPCYVKQDMRARAQQLLRRASSPRSTAGSFRSSNGLTSALRRWRAAAERTSSARRRRRRRQPLSANERAVYNLIARAYLAQFYPPVEYYQLEAEISIAGERFDAKGRQPISVGWRRILEPSSARNDLPSKNGGSPADDEVDPESPLPPLQRGQEVRVARTRTVGKKTKPPRRFTSASLVQAMTGTWRHVSNPHVRQLPRETDGIGTPATQASIIQTLFDRACIGEQERQIVLTPTVRALIRALPDVATQPNMTALWEATLRKIQDDQAPLHGFLEAVRGQLGELVECARSAGAIQLPGAERALSWGW